MLRIRQAKAVVHSEGVRRAILFSPVALILILSGCNNQTGDSAPSAAPTVAALPDFSALDDVQEKKREFFALLKPIVESENARVLSKRRHLLHLYSQYRRNAYLPPDDTKWLRALAVKYRIPDFSVASDKKWRALRERVDIVPVGLAVAQAAHESAWGTSRLARLGNAVFGEWCFVTGCGIVPKRRSPGKTHEVAVFPTVNEAVRSYIHNLNCGSAYASLRQLRAAQREAGKAPDSHVLAGGLKYYSARRDAYVSDIRDMIRINRDYIRSPSSPS